MIPQRLKEPAPSAMHTNDVAGRDQRGGCRLCASTPLGAIRESRSDRGASCCDVQCTDSGVEAAVPVAVATVGPLGIAGAVGGPTTADRTVSIKLYISSRSTPGLAARGARAGVRVGSTLVQRSSLSLSSIGCR